jgi:16S rRNA (cytidine1402-2'-O)-methyltransferase
MAAMGTLYLVATPIGNLEDVTQRALRILSQVPLIAAEDTRRSGKLLAHYSIDTPTLSYYDHNKEARQAELLAALTHGDLALISDAGTPGISDPGFELVGAAWEAGHRVVPVPGPSAALAALTASGLPPVPFLFLGYLPRTRASRLELLEAHARDPWTMVAYEVPHRMLGSLDDIIEVLGPDRSMATCREISKVHEDVQRGTAAELRTVLANGEPRGEYTLVIGGDPEPRWAEAEVRAAVRQELGQGSSPSAAAREVARMAGWNRRDVYRMTLEE